MVKIGKKILPVRPYGRSGWLRRCRVMVGVIALIACSGLTLFVWAQTPPGRPGNGPTGTPLRIGQSELVPGGYLDFRYSYDEKYKHYPTAPATFDLMRLNLYLDGKITPDTTGRVQYDARSSALLDAQVSLSHVPYTDWKITVGQFKTPFSFAGEELSTPLQETVKGPLIYEGGSLTFPDREMGVLAEGEMLDKKGIYTFGVFNSNGLTGTDTTDIKDRMVQFRLLPWKDDSNSPLKPTEFGAAWIGGAMHTVITGTHPVLATYDRWAFSTKYEIEGVQITYEYFLQALDVPGPDNRNTKSWYLQLVWNEQVNLFNMPQTVHPVFRYEYYDPDTTQPNNKTRITTVGFNWDINQAMRVQVNYNYYKADAPTKNSETLVQLGIKF